MLTLKNITKDYVTSSEKVSALKGISISFRKNEFVSILGPSGCGKTTLLNIIGGLDHYTSGDLVIGGRSTGSYTDRDWDVYRNHRIGFIFQSYNLIPHQTVLGNVELALTISGVGKEERIERAKKALDRVGLRDQYYKRPNQLSGGQCQRVAIARALVNDPEILLADEPTGALDTQTSKQIMELIKEISGERLVIMVTHNPEIADEYSSRIVRLLDGLVIEDTDPFSEEDEIAEVAATNAEESAAFAKETEGLTKKEIKKKEKKKRERAKMSFFTAFKLSARNLISKRGRTAMVGFAGSIGIIGIALVLAFSAGIKGYVASMQDDMLSGNPIKITETTYDLSVLTGMMSTEQKEDIVKHPNYAYVSSVIEYIAKASDTMKSAIIKNDITESYIDFVKAMPKEYYNALLFGYGINLAHGVYTDYVTGFGDSKKTETLSTSALTEMYTAILNGTDFSDFASYINVIAPSFEQAPDNPDYINSQYTVYGKIATEYDEIMLVLNKDQELSDILLARLGFYTEEQFFNIIYKATGDDRYDSSLDVDSLSFDALLDENKTLVWYPNDAIFEKQVETVQMGPVTSERTNFLYKHNADAITSDRGVDLKIVGILMADENTTYGCLQSGVYYTGALAQHVLDENVDSEIANFLREQDSESIISGGFGGSSVYYNYEYRPYVEEGIPETVSATAYLGSDLSGFGGMFGGSGGSSSSSMKVLTLRDVGGDRVANSISVYPISFDTKYLVTEYLDSWNEDGDIKVGDVTIAKDDRAKITYTDTLELIINLINTMIDVVSYALIAFTSVSLVVSTVMIGIITYVSVVERIKEIGVIRSLGGRKKDVSHLFNAETFIIGLLAGVIGVAVTYLISAAANAILKPLIGYSRIAALPLSQAVALVILSIGLTLISGLIPASSAAKRDPVVALRTE